MNEVDIIFNRYGEPILRLLSNGRLVTFSGQSIGFLDGENLYTYKGKHVGWFELGIVRDHRGAVVGFGLKPTDSTMPFLPYRQWIPYRGYVGYEPYRPYKGYAPYKPFKLYSWSDFDPVTLFEQV
jgi:hypothetical protein